MTVEEVEAHLMMHVLNIGLAAMAGRNGDLRECKSLLAQKVHDMIEHEVRHALTSATGQQLMKSTEA